MTLELTYLTLVAVLAASLWIPFIVGVNMAAYPADPFDRPHDLTALPSWVHRAHRAHLNLIESALPFSVAVVIAHLAAVSTSVTIVASVAFFWLRVAHAIGMISGYARFPLRPLLFVASWLCTLAIAVQLLLA